MPPLRLQKPWWPQRQGLPSALYWDLWWEKNLLTVIHVFAWSYCSNALSQGRLYVVFLRCGLKAFVSKKFEVTLKSARHGRKGFPGVLEVIPSTLLKTRHVSIPVKLTMSSKRKQSLTALVKTVLIVVNTHTLWASLQYTDEQRDALTGVRRAGYL